MKVIIDIPEEMITDIKEIDFDFARSIVRNFQATIADAIRNGKPIPNNATTGDMIKMLFPDVEVDGRSEDTVHLKDNWHNPLVFIQIPKDIWNAPFKKEVEE